MAKDGLGSVIDRAEAHQNWYAKFYANVAPMMQEPRQQWRRRVRRQLKANRIMPKDGVNRARVSIRVIELANGLPKGWVTPRKTIPHGSEIKFTGLES